MIIKEMLIDIIKDYILDWSKVLGTRLKKDDIDKVLQTFPEKFENSILDSGSLNKFLNLTETKFDFQNFIEYGVYKNKLNEEKLTKKEFLKIISQKAFLFVKAVRNKELKEIPLEDIEEFFTFTIDLIEKVLIKNMSKDISYNNYLLRIKIDEIVERINITKNYRPCLEQNVIEEIKGKYINMMLARYKTVHIYGIDELKFNSFYIRPSFSVSIQENELSPIVDNLETDYDKTTIPIEWSKIFSYSNIISVIGGAGFGKTLFLKNMINYYADLNVLEAKNMLPIYCDLKKFAEKIKKDMKYTIKDFLIHSMIYDTSIKEINEEFLEYFLKKGMCIILFDALDEADSEERMNVYNLIVAFFENVNKNNKVCITSRERGFIPKTKIIYKVNPVNKEKTVQYVDKLISINRFKGEHKEKFIFECEKLINNGFLKSFLMLSLLVNIYKAERSMPKSKIELYKKAVEYISKEREFGLSGECVKKATLKFDLIESIINTDESFEKLAYLSKPNNNEVDEEIIKKEFLELHNVNYSSRNETALAIKEFLKFCSERTELFVKYSEKKYKFYHKSFFEYFYSKHMISNMNYEELCNEISTFDYSQEIPSIVMELMRDIKFSEYKNFVNFVLNNIKENKLNFFKSLNIIVNIVEPGYLLEIYDLFFNNKKVMSQNLLNTNKIKENGKIVLSVLGITEYLIFNSVIKNTITDKRVLRKKDIRNDIKKYYKEEYLEVMYVNYLFRHKTYKNKSIAMVRKNKFKQSLSGLNILYDILGNIFDINDFDKSEILSILRHYNIGLDKQKYWLKEEEKEILINSFYDEFYIKKDIIDSYTATTNFN